MAIFSDKYIQNLKPRTTAFRIFEKSADRGFGVRVTPNGHKTFFLCYRHGGLRRFMNLGGYPEMSLQRARERCREYRGLNNEGVDPQVRRETDDAKQREQVREATLKGSVAQLFDTYVESLKAQNKRSAPEVARALRKDAVPILGEATKARDVQSAQIKLTLHRVLTRGKEVYANRLYSHLHAAFQFGLEHDNDPRQLNAPVLFGLQFNPVGNVPRPYRQEKPGNRALSWDEIKTLWDAIDTAHMAPTLQLAVKLILATGGQRVEEVLNSRWPHFDLSRRLWEMPTTKNGRPHTVPLGDIAVDVLENLRRYTGGSAYLFPKLERKITTDSPFIPSTSLSRALSRFCIAKEFTPFTPRDLRRTCKTRLAEIGVPKHIRDRLHNHSLHDVSSRHYDRYEYLAEKRQWMEIWDQQLMKIIRGDSHQAVVPFDRRTG